MNKFIFIVSILLFLFSCSESDNFQQELEKTEEYPGSIEIPPTDANTPPGIVVSHMPKSESIYLGSPSICVLPNGDYIASYDWFGPNGGSPRSGQTFIFRSQDKGATWIRICTIDGQFWSNVFLFRNNLYIMGTDKGQGNIVIRRSMDYGITWTKPISKTKGLLFEGAYHTAPTPVIEHEGRVWRAFEYANAYPATNFSRYGALMLSADANSDLLDASNWTMSNYLPYDPTYLNNKFQGWIEGNAVIDKEGNVLNLLRVHVYSRVIEHTAILKVSKDGKTVSFDPDKGFIKMPGSSKKFTIRYDKNTNKYWSLVNYVPDTLFNTAPSLIRNYLALISSDDLLNWDTHKIVLSHPDSDYHAFQYVDWVFDEDDIIFLSRTAFDDDEGGADTYHNSNYITFHRIVNYKNYLSENIK